MSDETSNGGDDDTPPPFDVDATGDDGRPIGELFETVSDRRARYVLAHLESLSVDVVDLEDIADHVARREREVERESEAETGGGSDPASDGQDANKSDDTDNGSDFERRRHRVAVALHHNHLPKLDAAAVLDYDPRSRTVRYRGDDRVTTVLDLLEAAEDG